MACSQWSGSPIAACRPRPSPVTWWRAAPSATVRQVRAQYLQDWLVDPEAPLTWRMQKDRGLGCARRHRRARYRPLAVHHWTATDRVSGVLETFVKERPVLAETSGLGGTAGPNAAR